MDTLRKLLHEEHAQGMAEYAIVLGVIAVGIAAVLVLMRGAITNKYNNVINELK